MFCRTPADHRPVPVEREPGVPADDDGSPSRASSLTEGLPFSVDDFSEAERIEQRSIIRLTTEQTIANASFGLSDRIDIGVIVPYIRQTVSGEQRHAVHVVTQRPAVLRFVRTALRRLVGPGRRHDPGQVPPAREAPRPAAAVDVRLPTGDEDNLLGAGSTQTSAMLAAAAKGDDIAPHFNIGYTFGGGGLPDVVGRFEPGDFRPSNEFKYTIGTEFMVSGPVTIAGDIIGRTMFNAPQPDFVARPGRELRHLRTSDFAKYVESVLRCRQREVHGGEFVASHRRRSIPAQFQRPAARRHSGAGIRAGVLPSPPHRQERGVPSP